MVINANKIQEIYAGRVVNRYDSFMSHFFKNFKNKAFNESSLKQGETVLVFCCGTGLDFPYILNKIGSQGKIIGIDFSEQMLSQAENKIQKHNWINVELIQADVTTFKDKLNQKADAGVCTLGLSIIPDYKTAYYNLLSNIKHLGEVIIGDMQLASGWQARLNPLTIFLAKRFGGSYEGHSNSLELIDMMNKDLKDFKKRELFFKSYYYCFGKNNYQESN